MNGFLQCFTLKEESTSCKKRFSRFSRLSDNSFSASGSTRKYFKNKRCDRLWPL